MKLPKYVFIYPASDLPGAGLILHTRPPYVYGAVMKFKDEREYLQHVAAFDGSARCGITGYNIDIVFAGAMGPIQFEPSVKSTIIQIIGEMADYYFTERIKPWPGRFSKFIS